MERRLRLVPLKARVLDPEVGVVALAPIRHSLRVDELDAEVEAAHLAVLVEVPDQFVLQAVRVTFLQGWAGLSGEGVAECFTTSTGP